MLITNLCISLRCMTNGIISLGRHWYMAGAQSRRSGVCRPSWLPKPRPQKPPACRNSQQSHLHARRRQWHNMTVTCTGELWSTGQQQTVARSSKLFCALASPFVYIWPSATMDFAIRDKCHCSCRAHMSQCQSSHRLGYFTYQAGKHPGRHCSQHQRNCRGCNHGYAAHCLYKGAHSLNSTVAIEPF